MCACWSLITRLIRSQINSPLFFLGCILFRLWTESVKVLFVLCSCFFFLKCELNRIVQPTFNEEWYLKWIKCRCCTHCIVCNQCSSCIIIYYQQSLFHCLLNIVRCNQMYDTTHVRNKTPLHLCNFILSTNKFVQFITLKHITCCLRI